jgi:parallel beta helix pectate lyase-like protein
MSPAVVRKRSGNALGIMLGLLALGIPMAVLVHGAEPARKVTRTARALPANQPLSLKCARRASTVESLGREYAAASPGETVCLASGRYGTFYGGKKQGGPVAIRAQRGAKVSMALDLDSTVNLRLEDLTITTAQIRGTSRNITIAHSRFTGLAIVHADLMENANIVFDHNVHADVDTCTSCFQGRLHIDGNTGRPAGVVIKNSVFSGGDSDGVRADADGIKVLDNRFVGFRDRDPFHTDPIQLYGGTHVTIRGNYFHDNNVSAQIMMADGGAHNVVEDNVVSGGGYTWAITWFSDNSSIIRHNTFAVGQCDAGVRCGMLNLGAKASDPAGHGTIIRDNVMGGISNHGEAKLSGYRADHNFTGAPTFRGPLGTFSGYRLASHSSGTGHASDGKDPGIR